MSADTDLELVFRNAAGKKVSLNIEEPKTGIKKAEIDAAMPAAISWKRWKAACVPSPQTWWLSNPSAGHGKCG